MTAKSKANRIPVVGVLLAFVALSGLVATCFYVHKSRRIAQANAILSYSKGEADCRLLGSRYLDLAAKEQAEALKSEEGSKQRAEHLAAAMFYKKMADNSYRIAESNAEMAKKLNHSNYKP